MRAPVLVAPDKFKGTLRAPEVAAALGRGLEAAGWPVDLCPVADGGDGTIEVLLPALGGETVGTRALDPLGRERAVGFALVEDGAVALVEMAEASGLALLAADERDPERASSYGTGQLLVAAAEAGAAVIVVAVGGSATVDGGAGALRAVAAAGGLGDARVVVLCDVTTPWERAAAVFGPQKGASPAGVARLEARLDELADSLDRDPRGRLLTGAAGGLAGGLWAGLGAVLEPGAAWVLNHLGFSERMRAARAVVVGEGRLDASTLEGKAVAEVARAARQAGVPCHAVVGQAALEAFDRRILDLESVREAGSPEALEDAGRRLGEHLTAEMRGP